MSEMVVERVARALWSNAIQRWQAQGASFATVPEWTPGQKAAYEPAARAAIAAMREPPNMVELCEIGRKASEMHTGIDPSPSGLANAWRAMIDEILKSKRNQAET